jgi:hypothetical protein
MAIWTGPVPSMVTACGDTEDGPDRMKEVGRGKWSQHLCGSGSKCSGSSLNFKTQ